MLPVCSLTRKQEMDEIVIDDYPPLAVKELPARRENGLFADAVLLRLQPVVLCAKHL